MVLNSKPGTARAMAPRARRGCRENRRDGGHRGTERTTLVHVILALALTQLLGSAPGPGWPVQVEALVRETPEGPLRAWIARVSLLDPRVSFVVTSPMERRPGDPERAEAHLIPTDAWAEKAAVELAVNANFFARLEGTGLPALGWTEGLPVDLLGLSRSEGRSVSPPRLGEGNGAAPDPALLIDEGSGGHCPCVVRAAAAGGATSPASRTRSRVWASATATRARCSSRTARTAAGPPRWPRPSTTHGPQPASAVTAAPCCCWS